MTIETTLLKNTIKELTEKVIDYEASLVELKKRIDIQDSLNGMLNISLMPISLKEQMERVLSLLLNISWLALDKKGCVFLTDDSGKGLQIIAHQNLSDSLLKLCNHIQFGQCLCGKAAVKQTLLFKNCTDSDHEIRYEGMQPHGHYNIPILSNGKTLGVLNLYVKHGLTQTALETEFLAACTKAMTSIIERKKIEEQLHNLSQTDELTGIANRRQFVNHMDALLIESKQHKRQFSVLFIDLDHFKAVNDTYGHEYGDQVLIHAAQRIQSHLRQTDLLARLGGDEFIIALEMISSADKILEIAKGLIHSLSMPYHIKEQQLIIGASIGISLYPKHGTSSEALIKYADHALYQAKGRRGEAAVYNENS